MEELDFELRKTYELTVRATDIQTGSYAEAIVHVQLEVNIYEYITCFRRKKRKGACDKGRYLGVQILCGHWVMGNFVSQDKKVKWQLWVISQLYK